MFALLRRMMNVTSGKRRRRQSCFSRQVTTESLKSRCLLTSLSGRGQDALLIVNPDSENAIRIAAAYQELRNIPDDNILFVSPPADATFTKLQVPAARFWNEYVQTVHGAIHDRGLADQIDFIAAVGQPHSFYQSGSHQSLSYGLMQLDQYAQGMSIAAAQSQASGIARLRNVRALHHSDSYANVPGSTTGTQRYYVSGLLAVTEQLGNSADQVIENLRRTASADGTKPSGTIYFEDNGNVRAATRRPQWPAAQRQLTNRGIPYFQEYNVSGGTPRNRNDVRGGVIGAANARLPNGSQYLPGSWVDNLTSYGARYTTQIQTKATQFIATGAAASSGTVAEPYAISSRFPSAQIFTHIDSGLTLGEAFYQAVDDPDMQQFIGDILAQPYGDIPTVTLTAPAAGQTVSGTLSVNAAASVTSGGAATAVERLELYVDGRLQMTRSGSRADFSIDTTGLSDGLHEFRVVAVANNAAESEGIAVRDLRIDNKGQFVSLSGRTFSGRGSARLQIPVSVTADNSSVQRIELRHMGRVVATAVDGSTQINLPLNPLAYGANEIVPVAVLANGDHVFGESVVVNRNPVVLPGLAIPSAGSRTPGIQAEYFLGAGGSSIDESDFTGEPTISARHVRTHLLSNTNNNDLRLATSNVDKLAVRLSGSFNITAADAGEVSFSSIGSNDSFRLLIDGERLISYDNRANGIGGANASASIFLGPGRHDFEILAAATGAGDRMKINVVMRAKGGVTRYLEERFVYTANSSAATTTISAPVITHPAGTVSTALPQVRWDAVENATEYDVQILNTSLQVLSEGTVSGRTFVPTVSLRNGNYTARVRARGQGLVSDWASRAFRVSQSTSGLLRVIIVEQTDGTTVVTEGGSSDLLAVRLQVAPEQDVIVTANSDIAGQVHLSRTELFFRPTNWSIPQYVTVAAIDDSIEDGDQTVRLTFSVAGSSDPTWLATPGKVVSATVIDNEPAGGGTGGGGGGTGGSGGTGGAGGATAGSSVTIDKLATKMSAEHGLSPGDKDFYDWGGRQERWIRGDAGWYFITPDGSLYQWNGSRPGSLSGSLIARLDSRYHADITRFAAPVVAATTESVGLASLDRTYQFDRQESYWQNWGGLQEKWFRSTANQQWFYLKPNGNFYRWTGGGRGNLRGSLVATIQTGAYQDPSLLYEATAIAVDEQLALTFSGSFHQNWGGQNEKWLRGTTGWYYLTPAGKLYQWNRNQSSRLSGTLQADLGAGYYADPTRLYNALDRVYQRWSGANQLFTED